MRNKYYFQIYVTPEQIDYTNKLVDYSLKYHKVKDIFADDPGGKRRQREFRFTGSLGEVVFADTYKTERPTRSFGAVDGQDYGKDFLIDFDNKNVSIDIKSMGRKSNFFRENYVLNIPSYQLHKSVSLTDYYYCISFHKINYTMVATFVGYIKKKEIIDGTIGSLNVKGSTRKKDDGTPLLLQHDTYEVPFKDITSPILPPYIKNMYGFKLLHIQPKY